MAEYGFIVQLSTSLGAGATATLSYQVPTNEQLVIKSINQVSSGAFDINRIYDSQGRNYSNASSSNPIPSDAFNDLATDATQLNSIGQDIVLTGGTTIYFDVEDTSAGSNTIQLTLTSIKKTGS